MGFSWALVIGPVRCTRRAVSAGRERKSDLLEEVLALAQPVQPGLPQRFLSIVGHALVEFAGDGSRILAVGIRQFVPKVVDLGVLGEPGRGLFKMGDRPRVVAPLA